MIKNSGDAETKEFKWGALVLTMVLLFVMDGLASEGGGSDETCIGDGVLLIM